MKYRLAINPVEGSPPSFINGRGAFPLEFYECVSNCSSKYFETSDINQAYKGKEFASKCWSSTRFEVVEYNG